jgi:thiol-disulfide isomerase/thioredoxin
VRFVPRDETLPLARAVAEARKAAYAHDRQFLVYVGAKWCEPCRYFHQAALDGSLDAAFPKLDLMEFDLDKDRGDLGQAGYTSRLIPLFSKANADGSASKQRHSGGIKGPKSVQYLTNKLEILLAGQPGKQAI